MALLEVARAALRAAVQGDAPPHLPEDLPARLRVPGGVFVSLHAGEALRGCIGSCVPHDSLAELVADMAAAAATRDPRFSPVRADELRGLSIEISVLSATRDVPVEGLEPRRHGVSLRLGRRHAVLLPQVAARHGWDRLTLLAQLCDKADLPTDAWRDPAAILSIFTVESVAGDV
jgi:AmmeMemoRadiSam system protein A